MKLNFHFVYIPIILILVLSFANGFMAISAQKKRMLNLIRAQDEVIFSALEFMATPSDTAAQKKFLRSFHISEQEWKNLSKQH